MEISGARQLDDLRVQLIQALEASHKGILKDSTQLITGFKDELMSLLEGNDQAATTQIVIRSLKYDQMTARQRSIDDAHKRTFDWLLNSTSDNQNTNHDFVNWLTSGSGIYWVAGKAGSGKSTLMKYLFEHSRTKDYLRTWAGGKKLVMASHYFWIAGSKMQKSQEGLLSSLLDTIFTRCPILIPTVAPWRWGEAKSRKLNWDPWTRKELLEAFGLLTKQRQVSTRFCFFVDGLDEYDGDHTEVIRILQDLATSSNIKICVSSRPWNVFEKTLGKDSTGQLYLQDLTRNDIRLYVHETLEVDQRFLELDEEDGETPKQDVIEAIVDLAHGVFLWVVLVVRDLLRGMSNDDTVTVLQKRLHSLPPTLEEYFQLMLDRIDTVYQEQTAQIIFIMLEAEQPPTLMSLAFLDEYQRQDAIQSLLHAKSNMELEALCAKTRTRVKARCCDILEVTTMTPGGNYFDQPRVVFLHRTVRDFVLTSHIQKQLRDQLRTPFDPHAYFCEALLLQTKVLPSYMYCRSKIYTLAPIVHDFMFYSHSIEKSGTLLDLAKLDEMELVLECHVSEAEIHLDDMRNPERTWPQTTASTFSPIADRIHYAPPGQIVFQAAIQFGFLEYVKRRLSQKAKLVKGTHYFVPLYTALAYPATEERRVDRNMVKLLLDHGASPFQCVPETGGTVWSSALKYFGGAKYLYEDSCVEALELLLTVGRRHKIAYGTMIKDLLPSGPLARIFSDSAMRRLREVAGVPDRDHRTDSLWYTWSSCCTSRTKRRRELPEETSPLLGLYR
jgi:hypothetical protein